MTDQPKDPAPPGDEPFDPTTGEVPPSKEEAYSQHVASARRRQRARAAIVVGVGVVTVVVVVLAAGWLVWKNSGTPQQQGEVQTRPGPKTYEPPGRANLPADVAQAAREANKQELQAAAAQGKDFTPALVFDKSKPLEPAPPSTAVSSAAAPGQKLQSFTYPPEQRRTDPAQMEKIRASIKVIVDKGSTARGGLQEAQVDPEGFARALGYDTRSTAVANSQPGGVSWNIPGPGKQSSAREGAGKDAMSAGRGSGNGQPDADRKTGHVLATPHRAFGMTEVAMDSDAPAAVIVDVVSGPLTGGKLFGSFTSAYDTEAVTFNRLNWHGRDISVEAIAVDLDQLTPALPAETDERYFARVVLPAATAFLGAAANSFAQPSQTTIITSGIASQTTPQRTARQDLGAGVSGAANAVGSVLNAEASATKRRVWIDALQPVGIWFIRNVEE